MRYLILLIIVLTGCANQTYILDDNTIVEIPKGNAINYQLAGNEGQAIRASKSYNMSLQKIKAIDANTVSLQNKLKEALAKGDKNAESDAP